MATSREDIQDWFKEGVKKNATHLVVVTDTYDHEDYPVYVEKGQDPHKVVSANNDFSKMTRVQEVYCLAMDMNTQLNESRSYNFGTESAPIKASVLNIPEGPQLPPAATLRAELQARKAKEAKQQQFKELTDLIAVIFDAHNAGSGRVCVSDMSDFIKGELDRCGFKVFPTGEEQQFVISWE